jgi:TetR/AcrR family transcriptional repressor of nem operon
MPRPPNPDVRRRLLEAGLRLVHAHGFSASGVKDITDAITRFFHALADDHEAGDFLLGCLIGNLSLELGGISEPVRAELVSILDGWNEALTACVRSGQNDGIRDDVDAAELASLLIEAWEGAALRGKVTRSRTPYDRFEAITVPALLR